MDRFSLQSFFLKSYKTYWISCTMFCFFKVKSQNLYFKQIHPEYNMQFLRFQPGCSRVRHGRKKPPEKINYIEFLTYEIILKCLGLTSLERRWLRGGRTEVYRIMKAEVKMTIKLLFTKSCSARPLRTFDERRTE